MANVDAFNSGFDAGTKKGGKKGDVAGHPSDKLQTTPKYKKGGKVKKTGLAQVHKGEVVLTAKQAKKYKARKKVAGKR